VTASIDAGPTGVPLIESTIGDDLRRAVAAHGDREALVSVHQNIRWTYAELGERVQRLARGLLARGLQQGDRVGLWSPNHAEWTLVQYATAEIGVILVNINPAYRSHELAYVLDQSGIRLLIAAPAFKTSDYRAMVDEVRAERTQLEDVLFLWDPEWEALWDDASLASVEELDARRAGLRPDDPINI
jgi:fatty-acyl-CoA synthase